jgi:hypothetical protein
MKRQIDVCDRCGKSAETPKGKEDLDLKTIGAGFASGPYVNIRNPAWVKDYCINCRTALGIATETQLQEAKPKSIPTLEDMIRELVAEEVAANWGN